MRWSSRSTGCVPSFVLLITIGAQVEEPGKEVSGAVGAGWGRRVGRMNKWMDGQVDDVAPWKVLQTHEQDVQKRKKDDSFEAYTVKKVIIKLMSKKGKETRKSRLKSGPGLMKEKRSKIH